MDNTDVSVLSLCSGNKRSNVKNMGDIFYLGLNFFSISKCLNTEICPPFERFGENYPCFHVILSEMLCTWAAWVKCFCEAFNKYHKATCADLFYTNYR